MRTPLLPTLACTALAVMLLVARDAPACGMFFTRPLTESELESKLPYLAVERVLLAWDPTTQTEDFVREARFEKASQAFGFVVPVPSRPEVFKVDQEPFDALAAAFPFEPRRVSGSGMGRGAGGGKGSVPPAVIVLSEQRIGSFTAFVLAATDADGLARWLRDNGLQAPPGAQGWLEHYVHLGFFYVAFRYDSAGDKAGMTSETVRIRFKTPLPYYPYLEPPRPDSSRGPRDVLLWFTSRAEHVPVASVTSPDGLSWKQPWEVGKVQHVTAKQVRDALPSLGELVPANDAEPWVVVPYRDGKAQRSGWGDVLMVPSNAVAADDAAIAALWPLLPVLDPRLEGDLDARPPSTAALFPPLEALPRVVDPARAPSSSRTRDGCTAAPGETGTVDAGAMLLLAGLLLLARRRGALVAAAWMVGACKTGEVSKQSSPTPTPAQSALDGGSTALAFSRDGAELLLADLEDVSVRDVATGAELRKLDVVPVPSPEPGVSRGAITQLEGLPDHRVLVDWDETTTRRGMLSVYDTRTGKETWRQEVTRDHTPFVFALSDDARRLLTAGGDGSLRLWDMESHQVLRDFAGRTQDIGRLTFLGADRALTMAGRFGDHTMRVWDLSSGTEQRAFEGPPGYMVALAVTPDGARLVTLGDEGGLRVWDPAAGRELRSFDLDGSGSALDVKLSRDGRRAYTQVSAGACAWDLEAARLLDCSAADRWSGRGSAALSPDGRWMALTTDSGARFWQVPEQASPSSPPAWPGAPPWSSAAQAVVLAPPADSDRVVRERASLSLALGRVSAARLPVDAQLRTSAATVLADAPVVVGQLPPEGIQRIVRQNLGRFRLCYENALHADPSLHGHAAVNFVIDRGGSVTHVTVTAPELHDAKTLQCVQRGFEALSFPEPAAGTVSVTYRLSFDPPTGG